MYTEVTSRRKFVLAIRQSQALRGDAEQGTALLETAFSLLTLFIFIIGMMEIGLAAYTYHVISESAREGTRYAIVRGATWGTACGGPGPPTCTAQSADVQTYVKSIGFPGINPGKMTVTPVWSGFTHGSSCPAVGPCNSVGNLITITVQYNFPVSIPFVSTTGIAMSSTSAMIISQ